MASGNPFSAMELQSERLEKPAPSKSESADRPALDILANRFETFFSPYRVDNTRPASRPGALPSRLANSSDKGLVKELAVRASSHERLFDPPAIETPGVHFPSPEHSRGKLATEKPTIEERTVRDSSSLLNNWLGNISTPATNVAAPLENTLFTFRVGGPSIPTAQFVPDTAELKQLRSLITATNGEASHNSEQRVQDELRITPLIWWNVKDQLARHSKPGAGLKQYAVLGHEPSVAIEPLMPVLLNTNSPWSAFLCGSQGSGKSHALSCMLENCLLQDSKIGPNPNPLAGLVFHYDRTQGFGVCEAAYLCSAIPTRVLVSSSNYGKLKLQYEKLAADNKGRIDVQPLRLLPALHLDTERMKSLMATGKDSEMPLYMHTLVNVLREMAIQNGGSGLFDYEDFIRRLDEQGFTQGQSVPLQMRLHLLESFLDLPPKTRVAPSYNGGRGGRGRGGKNPLFQRNYAYFTPGPDFLTGQPGTLTIVDLTDPVVDPDSACVLFDICLSVFIAQTKCSKIVALDEAHNYMGEHGNSAVKGFTEKLLKTIREQRHTASRIVIATQEPTVNTQLLDLCSITMVHRCTSPAWFAVLKKHIAGLCKVNVLRKGTQQNEEGGFEGEEALFHTIVKLKIGESLLFCPTAAVDVDGREIVRMDAGYRKFKTRRRITADGGITKTASGL